jgi:hypothetical protein
MHAARQLSEVRHQSAYGAAFFEMLPFFLSPGNRSFVVPPADHAKHDDEADDHKDQHHNGHVANLHTLAPENPHRAPLEPEDADRKQNEERTSS